MNAYIYVHTVVGFCIPFLKGFSVIYSSILFSTSSSRVDLFYSIIPCFSFNQCASFLLTVSPLSFPTSIDITSQAHISKDSKLISTVEKQCVIADVCLSTEHSGVKKQLIEVIFSRKSELDNNFLVPIHPFYRLC